ncbi:unnamed protein product [Soboliphyme baturini]|uniref:CPSF_A domain-containing protein n=1 Tax=Soboliphyme baturini TaxID=241478 RepID=A0A183IW65_9BILA|nr:unnamed protein product [Soboliphyme baturini]
MSTVSHPRMILPKLFSITPVKLYCVVGTPEEQQQMIEKIVSQNLADAQARTMDPLKNQKRPHLEVGAQYTQKRTCVKSETQENIYLDNGKSAIPGSCEDSVKDNGKNAGAGPDGDMGTETDPYDIVPRSGSTIPPILFSKLPSDFMHEVVIFEERGCVENCPAFYAKVRVNVTTAEEFDRWLSGFEMRTHTHYVLNATLPCTRHYTFGRRLVCQHNRCPKKVDVDSHEPRRLKSFMGTNCHSRIKVGVKPWKIGSYNRDVYTKMGLAGVIDIVFDHNHPVGTADSLGLLPLRKERFASEARGFRVSPHFTGLLLIMITSTGVRVLVALFLCFALIAFVVFGFSFVLIKATATSRSSEDEEGSRASVLSEISRIPEDSGKSKATALDDSEINSDSRDLFEQSSVNVKPNVNLPAEDHTYIGAYEKQKVSLIVRNASSYEHPMAQRMTTIKQVDMIKYGKIIGIAFRNHRLYVASYSSGKIVVFSTPRLNVVKVITSFGPFIYDIAVLSDGSIVATSSKSGFILKYVPSSNTIVQQKSQVVPGGIAVTPEDHVFVLSKNDHLVHVYDRDLNNTDVLRFQANSRSSCSFIKYYKHTLYISCEQLLALNLKRNIIVSAAYDLRRRYGGGLAVTFDDDKRYVYTANRYTGEFDVYDENLKFLKSLTGDQTHFVSDVAVGDGILFAVDYVNVRVLCYQLA